MFSDHFMNAFVFRPAYAPTSDHELSEDENDNLHEPEEFYVSSF